MKEKTFWRVMLDKYGKAEVCEIHEYHKPDDEGGSLANGGIVFFDTAMAACILASVYNN